MPAAYVQINKSWLSEQLQFFSQQALVCKYLSVVCPHRRGSAAQIFLEVVSAVSHDLIFMDITCRELTKEKLFSSLLSSSPCPFLSPLFQAFLTLYTINVIIQDCCSDQAHFTYFYCSLKIVNKLHN